MGWDIIDYDADPPHVNGDYIRDEDEPVRYMRELLDFFEAESVDTAFWHTFASINLPTTVTHTSTPTWPPSASARSCPTTPSLPSACRYL
ncbi:hypothetical protein GCM10009764_64430 [Nocardia ninae]|uniref:Uncharacterized protein n=1 Tax=Nocardia ninae NBRC 108245 TaxID=1210091 RepID=A0A511MDS6_9NOCA|nr:hypothetical protein NN4_33430 [Nocardia ninae NBRC 108245]